MEILITIIFFLKRKKEREEEEKRREKRKEGRKEGKLMLKQKNDKILFCNSRIDSVLGL